MPAAAADRRWGLWPALTVLTSAFLVFLMQPLVTKAILPWFGGAHTVWTTCLLFFQVALFVGYAYAHFSIRCLRPQLGTWLHVVLIFAALAALPILPESSWKPAGGDTPVWRILALLTVCVGLPYGLLSATGPLVQAWVGRSPRPEGVYRLYALSNCGSLAALMCYPLLLEPLWPTSRQAVLWTLGFGAFALCCGWVALLARHGRQVSSAAARTPDDAPPSGGRVALWLALPAAASAALLATTNHICQDIAAFPLLWVAPLALYLVTFIVAFDHPRWYRRGAVGLGAVVATLAAGTVTRWPLRPPLAIEVGVYLAMLFCVAMLCHGELVRLKPAPQRLTAFYLCIAGGGALGGALVSLAAPALFNSYFELPVILLLGFVGGLALWVRQSALWSRPKWALAAGAAGLLGMWCIGRGQAPVTPGRPVESTRNFYGVLCVDETDEHDPQQHARILRHGRVLHGLQFADAQRRREPTTYFDRRSGIGLVLGEGRPDRPLRVGTIGLGIGTLAAYGRAGDYYCFYEINPEIVRLAREHFTYLADCPATVDVVLGDARLSLENESPQEFDVLVLDAFSGDAIPTHLLTREAFQVYARHLKPDGLLALHVTNRHLNLVPLVEALAADRGCRIARVETQADEARRLFAANWLLVAQDETALARGPLRELPAASPSGQRGPLWTDDFSTVLAVLK
jgi:SAM-dependent methyltransferase